VPSKNHSLNSGILLNRTVCKPTHCWSLRDVVSMHAPRTCAASVCTLQCTGGWHTASRQTHPKKESFVWNRQQWRQVTTRQSSPHMQLGVTWKQHARDAAQCSLIPRSKAVVFASTKGTVAYISPPNKPRRAGSTPQSDQSLCTLPHAHQPPPPLQTVARPTKKRFDSVHSAAVPWEQLVN